MTVDALHYHASLVEAMADAVIGTDAEFRVTVWNPAAERLYGYSADEAMGRPARELLTFESDASRRELEDALDLEGHAHVELRTRRPVGDFVDVDVIVTAVYDDAGGVVGYLGIHRDITERKQVELEHRRLSAIVENSANFIGMADLDGHALFVNDAGQRLVGLHGMDEVRSKDVVDFFAPEDRARVRDELIPAILSGGRRTWELDFQNFESGERIPMSWDGFRVDDPDTGRPIALATISRDLTEHRRAEAELQAYRRRINTIFASITDAFYALDRDFRFAYLNARAVQVLGELLGERLELDDFLGRNVFEMFPGLVGTDTERNFRRAAREGCTIAYEYLYRPRSRWFDIHVYPSDEGLAVYFRDISDRKSAEEAGRRQARQAAAVAELGVRASVGTNAVELLKEAVAVASRTLDVELAAVAQVMPDGRLVLRTGVGWASGAVGQAEGGAGVRSLVGYPVETGESLVVEDVARDERCAPSQLLVDHEVTSAAVVVIPGLRGPFGALGVFSREARRFSAGEVNFLRAIANVLHGAIERAQMAERVGEARDAERRRIARALHDETLQELSVALARAAREHSTEEDDEGLVATLQRVGEQIRAAVHDLRLGDRHDETFPNLVEGLVAVHRSTAPQCDFDVDVEEAPDRVPGDVATEVLRVIGEALTNVRRHAAARRVVIRVAGAEGSLVVTVTDGGRGFDAEGRADVVLGRHGLVGMRERAELLGGELSVTSRPGEGTVVELRAPLVEPALSAERVRVLLVDDHAAIREALALAFAEDEGFVVAGQAGTLAEARTMLDGVDVAIIDLALPDGYGGHLIAELRAVNPQAQALVLSANVDRAATARAVENGAAAVLGKATHLHQVVAAVRRLRAGETLIPLEEMVELLRFAGRERERELDELRLADSLTAREREVLQLLADGLDGRGVAARLHISPRTQRNHMANILAKLDVHSQLQALVFGLRHGIVTVRGAPAPREDDANASFRGGPGW